jgi:hypothetical protein
MDILNTFKSWIGSLTEVVLMLLALGIACSLLAGADLPFFKNVTSNIISLVKQLGDGGLVGLISLGLILYLFSNRKLS